MRRFAVAVALVVLLSAVTGCRGGTVLIGARTDFPEASGTVCIVHVTVVDGNVQVTAVKLINAGSSQTLNFCGNVVSQFPSNAFVTVTYTQGSSCNTVMKVG
jgi:hypothetical protein